MFLQTNLVFVVVNMDMCAVRFNNLYLKRPLTDALCLTIIVPKLLSYITFRKLAIGGR